MESIRIGIIGTENSHALAAMERFNVKRSIPGATVSVLCPGQGDTLAHAREIAEQGETPHVVEDPEALLELADAVIIMNRHGGLHARYARLTLGADLPTFVDKPLTCDVAEAEQLVELSRQRDVWLQSWSTVWLGSSFGELFRTAENEIGPVSAGLCAGPCQLDSEHGGVFFYGIHTVEMMLQGFGYDVASLHAHREGPHATVTVAMASGKLVTLQLLGEGYCFQALCHGPGGSRYAALETGDAYDRGFQAMLRGFTVGERLLTDEELVQPVRVLAAIARSLEDESVISLTS
jgi:hypothetical protein